MSLTPDDLPPASEEELSAEHLPLTELESLSARPPSWRKRGAQIALVALAFGVALAVLWSAALPARRQIAEPTPAPISISALLVSNLTNATVTLNGKKLAGPLPVVVSAYLESDEVTITAPLFRPHTCHFKGLLTKEDQVHCLFTINNSGPGQNNPFYLIGVFLTPDDLLPAQQHQVIGPIMQQLATAQQATAQPGDAIATNFADGAITSHPASEQLQASATFAWSQLQTPSGSDFGYLAPSCAQLICPLGFGPGNPKPAGQVWDVRLNVMLRWRFTDGAGATIADVTYPPAPMYSLRPYLPEVRFVYDATGWHLDPYTDLNSEMQSALCQNGVAILYQRLLAFPGGFGITSIIDVGAAGCLVGAEVNGNENGAVLWRFGVLLAADKGAHGLLPDLPIASQAELAAASR